MNVFCVLQIPRLSLVIGVRRETQVQTSGPAPVEGFCRHAGSGKVLHLSLQSIRANKRSGGYRLNKTIMVFSHPIADLFFGAAVSLNVHSFIQNNNVLQITSEKLCKVFTKCFNINVLGSYHYMYVFYFLVNGNNTKSGNVLILTCEVRIIIGCVIVYI